MGNDVDYNRIYQLKNKVDDGIATKKEKDEYVLFLYDNGSISKEQYEKYISDNNSNGNDTWASIKAIGGIILAGYLLKRLFED